MKTLLFVCTGNTCRSPMAEAWARHLTADRPGWKAVSAGIGAVNGQPAAAHAIRAMQSARIDISGHRSQMLTGRLVRDADVILGMTHDHVESIRFLYPEASHKVALLRQFEPGLSRYELDILDPIGDTFDAYLSCRDQIKASLEFFFRSMEHDAAASQKRTLVRLALGSDHAGFALKEALKSGLAALGVEGVDVGTHSPDPADYPDFAQAAARMVASGRADFGLLICSSGIGVSIAANKVPGIRAALVHDEESASLCRRHNDANVLCLGARSTPADKAASLLRTFLEGAFEGGRHERRVRKLEEVASHTAVERVDPAVAEAIDRERLRQEENIELIASENFTSRAVMEAQGSVLTNKYAEGYPRRRWYGGCENVDVVEQLAIDRAKALFGAEHANVQPHSGSGANMAVYFSVLKPGDKLLTMDLSHGGHLTHGNKANFSGKFFEIVHYGVRREDELLDYDQLAALAREHRPKMITVGASAYPRVIDFERIGAVAREVGALLLADIAHIAGLVAAGVHPSPVPHADFVTSTTHKTLRGPRGGLILCRESFAKAVDSQVFPGVQGGPLMHVIAGKAICFLEAAQPEFKAYQEQVVRNSRALAEGLRRNHFRLVSGGSDNHVLLVDVGARGLTGKQCQLALDEAGITTNKNTIPFETRSPFEASGVRLGTPAVTTRGMREPEMAAVADMIAEVLVRPGDAGTARQVRERVRALTSRHPLPAG